MKNKLVKFTPVATLVLALALTLSCSSGDDGTVGSGCPNAITTPVNAEGVGSVACGGETYKTVKIGEQVWMARNLNYYANGSKCYGEGGKELVDRDADLNRIYRTLSNAEVQANCEIYGRLYDWATAMDIDTKYNNEEWGGSDVKHQGICPDGWHLPSKAEWDALFLYAGDISSKLKSMSGWINPYDGSNVNGTDEYGFSALPGGRYEKPDGTQENGHFFTLGSYGHWWISTEYDSGWVLVRYMGWYGDIADQITTSFNKNYLFSIRCLQD